MVVEMVACQVGEYAACEMQPGYAVLMGGMAADLHCCHGAAGVNHPAQQAIEFYGVGSRVDLGYFLIIKIINNSRQKTCAPGVQSCHFIDQGGDCRLAVGSRDADEREFARWITEPS